MPAHSKRRPTQAQTADRHVLYQKSVQAADWEVDFIARRYRALRHKAPLILREDFCGTALVCVEWCKGHPRRRAVGVDLCADTLDWGRRHNIATASPRVAARVSLINANVLDANAPKADITCAMNFSYCVFKQRGALRHYFETVRAGLKDDGLFFMDLLGGTETMSVMEEERDVDGGRFTYIWDQVHFNPIDHHLIAHIHFAFPDGSRIDRAFTYDWRLWTLPELREILTEAGFRAVRVYWEEFSKRADKNGYYQGTGRYREVTEADNQEGWIAYIVAER